MDDAEFLKRAIKMAEKSKEPVGCGALIVIDNQVVAEAYNTQREEKLATGHAEINAINEANHKLDKRTIDSAVAYCSCEPCVMCLTALSYAKISRIVFNKRLVELFPDDPQSQINCFEFVKRLNFIPKLEQLSI